MSAIRLPARYYQQFDADYSRDVPGEGYGGWKTAEIEISAEHTALVVMHAWETGGPGEYPGWRRAVEYHPRALKILRDVFPPILAAVRKSPLPVFHVVGGPVENYYRHLPGYRHAASLVKNPAPEPLQAEADPVYDRLNQFWADHVHVGKHNWPDVNAGFAKVGFAPEARPDPGEGLAESGEQLAALCREKGVNHLVYIGFAVNWCMVMSPGGLVDMRRHGVLCSVIADATTAVENRETAREEREKQQALWRFSLERGFIFESKDFITALPVAPSVSS